MLGEVVVAPEGAVWYHDALGEACGARGVVDECEFVGALFLVVGYVLSAEILGVFASEHLVEVFAGVGELVGAREAERVVGYVDDAFQSWHPHGIDLCGHDISHEEELRLAVVDDVMDLFGCELVEHWHGDGSIGESGEECHCPVCAVASAEGDLVASLNASVLEEDVEFLYLSRHVVVLQGDALIVGEGVAVPVVEDAFLDDSVE